MNCRFCNSKLNNVFVDLINSPASNSYLKQLELNEPEIFYPLKIFVCDSCKLVQIDEYKKSDDIFNGDYAYFSSFSTSWLNHANKYVNMITKKLLLDDTSHVIEIASNDGYLLQYFKEKNIPCLGIEPTSSTATVAKEKGIDVIEDFFSHELSKNLKKADLILGNNVLAHVPDINDFVAGLKESLKENGTITMEFPHILRLIEEKQFDTIYHEHFSYFSLLTIVEIFKKQGLDIYDVEELQTHGGSLRIYAKHFSDDSKKISSNILKILELEKSHSLDTFKGYENFQEKVDILKYDFLNFLIEAKRKNKRVVAYGAAAKGNTFLNYCGVKKDLIEYVVDKSPYKQNKFLPASHIPIVCEEKLTETKPDYIIILPWNIKDEIIEQLNYVRKWDCNFVISIPFLEIF